MMNENDRFFVLCYFLVILIFSFLVLRCVIKYFIWITFEKKITESVLIITKLWDACMLKYWTFSFIFLYLGHSCPVVWDCEDDHAVGGHVGQKVGHHHGLPWGSDHVGVHPQCARHDVNAVEEVADTVTILSCSDGVNLCYLRANTNDAIHALEMECVYLSE